MPLKNLGYALKTQWDMPLKNQPKKKIQSIVLLHCNKLNVDSGTQVNLLVAVWFSLLYAASKKKQVKYQ